MPTSHAILAPSASKRWLTCTPSARLEATVPQRETPYTREGTIAHSIAEVLLREMLANDDSLFQGHVALEWPEDPGDVRQIGGEALEYYLKQADDEGFDGEAMFYNISWDYCRLVWEDYQYAKSQDPDAVLLVEAQLKLDEYIPESFGSSDAVIIYGRTVKVYDLKYGKGVKVSAKENTQMMCYGLGAILGPAELYDIDKVVMTIIQPRLKWVSGYELTTTALLGWAQDELRPAAVTAFQGGGPFVPGDHCRFCAVAPRCKALGMQAASMNLDKAGDLMSIEEVSETLKAVTGLKSWIASLEAYALDQALSGNTVPGFKLVEGRSVRQISDQDAAITALAAAGFDESSYLRRDLKSITDLERLLTKKGFNALLGEYVTKPQGKPTLVEDSDPRPAMNKTADAINDFKDVTV